MVIGGTSGIGRAIARGFAADGADVVTSSRSADDVAETAAGLRSLGAETIEQSCDVTDRGSLVDLRDATIDALGRIDVLVTSQSYIARSNLTTGAEAERQAVFDVQLDGTYRAVQIFAERMDQGAIIPISSISNGLSVPNLVPYTAAELGPEIRVNAIRPGFVRTDQTGGTYDEGTDRHAEIVRRTTTGRLADPEEMVGAAIYLASDPASYTNGSVLTVDDGFTTGAFGD